MKILSEHWPRADEARLAEFDRSNADFPLHLLLVVNGITVGHCRLTQVTTLDYCLTSICQTSLNRVCR